MAVLVGVGFACLTVGSPAWAQTFARTLYVDRSLASSCTTYSVALKNCSGQDGTVYPTIQAAANVVLPGDRVLIRGGVYTYPARGENVLSRSGTSTQPILFEGYGSEQVILRGVGFEDRDLNGDTFADGPTDTGDRSALIRVTGSYIQVRKLEIEQAPYRGIVVSGDDNLVEEVAVRHIWMHGVVVLGSRNLIRYVDASYTRHHSGIFIAPPSAIKNADDNQVVRTLSHDNGRQADGAQALPIGGDPAGGGNSDGIQIFKDCKDAAAPGTNLCLRTVVRESIVWRNVDDGFDSSAKDTLIIGTVSIDNGPTGRRGFKLLRDVPGNLFVGNVAIASQYRGFEPRGLDTLDVFHNLAVGNVDKGVYATTGATGQGRYYNNVGFLNGGNVDFLLSGGDATNNWSGLAQGDPRLANAGAVIDLNLPQGTIEQRWQFLMNQVLAAYTPTAGSPLIDAGRFIPGLHCDKADDDPQSPMNPNAPCRHWMGGAPDLGAFEFGLGLPGLIVQQGLPPSPTGLTVR